MSLGIKSFAVGLAASAVIVSGGTAALAAGNLNHSTTGGSFNGQWEFYPAGVGHGGFHFWGLLNDTKNDGHAMKAVVRVAGYAPNDFYAPRDRDRRLNQEVYDPAATRTDIARFKICRHRGAFLPDNCSRETTHRR